MMSKVLLKKLMKLCDLDPKIQEIIVQSELKSVNKLKASILEKGIDDTVLAIMKECNLQK